MQQHQQQWLRTSSIRLLSCPMVSGRLSSLLLLALRTLRGKLHRQGGREQIWLRLQQKEHLELCHSHDAASLICKWLTSHWRLKELHHRPVVQLVCLWNHHHVHETKLACTWYLKTWATAGWWCCRGWFWCSYDISWVSPRQPSGICLRRSQSDGFLTDLQTQT